MGHAAARSTTSPTCSDVQSPPQAARTDTSSLQATRGAAPAYVSVSALKTPAYGADAGLVTSACGCWCRYEPGCWCARRVAHPRRGACGPGDDRSGVDELDPAPVRGLVARANDPKREALAAAGPADQGVPSSGPTGVRFHAKATSGIHSALSAVIIRGQPFGAYRRAPPCGALRAERKLPGGGTTDVTDSVRDRPQYCRMPVSRM
jgi:hypothetical protein